MKNERKISKKTKRMVVKPSTQLIKISDFLLAAPVATSSISYLCGVPQGTDINARIGNRIYPKRLIVKMTLTASSALIGSTVAAARFLIVQDLQQIQSTSPLITDVISPPTVVGQRNFYFLNRFRVLADFKTKVDVYNPNVVVNKTISLNGFIGYGSGASTDIANNGLYLIYLSNNFTNPPDMIFSSRLEFSN